MKKEFAILALAFYALFAPSLSSAQQTVGLFTKNTGQQDGFVMFTPNASDYTYLIDKCGKLVNKWNTKSTPGEDAYLIPGGNLVSTAHVTNSYFNSLGSGGGEVQIFNWNGTLLWKHLFSDSIIHQDHDIYPMPNGNILILEWERFTPAQCIAAGKDSVTLNNSPLWSVKIQEIKPIGSDSMQIVWEWRLWDHLIQDHDSTKPNYGVVADHPELFNINCAFSSEIYFTPADWVHANSVTYNPDLDQVMYSSRNMSEVYIIDHSTTTAESASHRGGMHGKGGDFLYRWGNPGIYDRGNASNRTLYGQHNASWIPKGYPGAGNITVFNDGDLRPAGNYSSAEIFAPPVDSDGNYKLDSGKAFGPSTSYWSYTAPRPTDFFSQFQGGVQRLINGNMLICEATKGNIFEVDSNKNLVWRYVNPDGGSGPVKQGRSPGSNTCFKAIFYMENDSAFNKIILKPGSPLELNPYSYYCLMPYPTYPNPIYNISQLKGYNSSTGIADSLNRGNGRIKGVVESQNIGNDSIQFSLVDSTGAIMVSTENISYKPNIGDSVLVTGIVMQSNGLTEYFADTVQQLSTGTWHKQPDTVTRLDESEESDIITINNVWMVNPSEWKAKGSGFTVHITNGPDTFVMYVNGTTDLFSKKALNEEFNVTGIEIQDKTSAPYFGDYQIEPRGSFDIDRVIQLYTISQVRVQNPTTGVSDSAGSPNNFYLKGIVQSPDFNTNGLNFSIKDSTGSIIIVSDDDINGYKPAIGDSIKLRGLLIQVNGLTEVVTDSISLLNNTSPILTPVDVLNLSESTEAQLVKLKGYYLTDTTQWARSGDSFDVNITNGIDSFVMRINSGTDLFRHKALVGAYDIIGIEIQDQPKSPYSGDYLIEPRGLFDIRGTDQLYKIRQVKVQDPVSGVADSAGSPYNFLLNGIVQSPDFSSNGLNFSIRDNTGSIIVVAKKDVNGYKPVVGDSIEIRGLLIQVNGLTEVDVDSISLLNNSSPVLTPVLVSDLSESTEDQLVEMQGYYLADISQWVATGDSFIVKITNGIDTFGMQIDSATDLYKMKPLSGIFNISGIEIQDQPSMPYLGDYEIEPRGSFDIERVVQIYKIRQLRIQDPLTGIADSAGSKNNFYLKGIVQSPDFSSKGLNFSIKDSTGSVIVVSKTDIGNYVPVEGDSIEIRGLLTQFNGLIEIVIDSSITVLKKASPDFYPASVSVLSESTEAQLVKLDGYHVIDTSKWVAKGDSFTVNITNGMDTFGMRINSSIDLFKKKPLVGIFNISGIEIQNRPASPYFGDYEIEPRGSSDLQRVIQLYAISQVRKQDSLTGVADSSGSPIFFYLKGIVQSPDFSSAGLDFSIKDSTGSIMVLGNIGFNYYKPIIGDSLELRGHLTQIHGLTEVITDSISVLKSSSPALVPIPVSILSEQNEAQLVKLKNYYLFNPSKWVASGDSFYVDITDGINIFAMRINATTDLFRKNPLVGIFNISGIEIQDKYSIPYFGNYEIEPRGSFDIERVVQLYKIRQVKIQNMISGIADSAGSSNNFYLKGIVQSPDLVTNGLYFSIKDSTGSIILTSAADVDGYVPQIGDSIEVRGLLNQVDGLIQVNIDSILILKNALPAVNPVNVSVLNESDQASLVKLYDYYLVDTSQWTPAGRVFDVKITNGTDTFLMEVTPATDLYNSKAIQGVFNIMGIEVQEQPVAPYFGNYEIIPRGTFDIQIVEQLYKINQVRVQDVITGIADSAGSPFNFYLKGIIQSPDFSKTGLNFSIKDNTGSIIIVSTSDISGYVPTVGDSIELRGLLTQVNGLTEVVTDSISVLKNASPTINSNLVSGLTESTEAQLVTLNGYHITDISKWTPVGTGFDVNITNGSDTFDMHISSATDLFKAKPLVGIFNITGIEIQNQPNSPYLDDYEIEPRGSFDIERVVQLYKIREVRVQDPVTGVADSSGSVNNFYLKGIVQSADLNASGLNFSLKDSTGSIMVVSTSDVSGYVPAVGDSIELRGLLTQVNGLTEVVPDLISVLKNASPAINYTLVSTLTEATEAQLVKLDGYYLTNASQWKPSGTGFDVNISNGTNNYLMHIGSGTSLFGMTALIGPFNVTGIELQNQSKSPYFGNYEIAPRGLFDIERYLQLYKIRQVRVQNPLTGVADSAGSIHPFLLKGIVQSPDFTISGYEFSIKDSTGSIFVDASNTINNYTPNVGDSIEIRGILTQINGLTEVKTDSISKLAGASPILVPVTITSLSESTEANLVKYDKAWLVNPSQWVATGAGFIADVTNGSDTIQLYISSATSAFNMVAPKGKFNVTGIGSQNKASAPYIGGYQLMPTAIGDIQFLPVNLYKIGEVKGYNAISGVADSINTYCLLKGIVQSGNLSGNTTEFYSLQDATGAITVTSQDNINGYNPATGDSIEARGTVLQQNGLTHFTIDSVSKLSPGVQISPVIVTSLDENSESELVTMNGYRLVDGTQWDTTGAKGSFEVKAYNGTDTITLKIVSGTDLYNNDAKPVHLFNITGIGSQNDQTTPYLSNYDLIPRGIADLHESSGIVPENLLSGKVEIYPNPTSGAININSTFNITEIQISDIVGKILFDQSLGSIKTYRIDLSSYKQGVYFVKIYDGENHSISKIIKN